MKKTRWLSKSEAEFLGLNPKENDGNRTQNRYNLTKDQWETTLSNRVNVPKVKNNLVSETSPNDYKEKKLILSAWSDKGFMMNINEYCENYKLPRNDISSYKLVSHTGTPFYNIVFKDKVIEEISNFNFEDIIAKYLKPVFVEKTRKIWGGEDDFDTLTYTDVHIGMESDSDNNTMYKADWNKKELMKTADLIIAETIKDK